MKPEEFMTGVLRTASGKWDEIIPRTSTAGTLNLLHATLGITSEIEELSDCADRVNAAEELGDILWFAALGYHSRGVMFRVPPVETGKILDALFDAARGGMALSVLYKASAELSSIVKAHMFYGRDLSTPEVVGHLDAIVGVVAAACHGLNLPMGSILEANQQKLKARYPDSFTEEKANVRDLVRERAALEDVKA